MTTTPTTEDNMNPSDVSARMDAITQVGRRVRLTMTHFRASHMPAIVGEVGTVTMYDGNELHVQLDNGTPCRWSFEYGQRPWLELEPLPNCSPQCAEVRGNQDCPGPTCAYRP